jgi:hypothetical protein
MAASSWIDSVWRMRGARSPVVGRVRAVHGPLLTLAVFGLGDQDAAGAEVLPGPGGARRLARLSLDTLLANWTRVDGAGSRIVDRS